MNTNLCEMDRSELMEINGGIYVCVPMVDTLNVRGGGNLHPSSRRSIGLDFRLFDYSR